MAFSKQALAADEPDYEQWHARFQTTYSWQRHPGYNARYFSVNSLDDEAETLYTFSATAMLGVRPWSGGELYLDVEAVQGNPFTGDLVGLGGFTNGEITYVGGNSLTSYRQRLFLRQTWNQGNGVEQLVSAPNQLAGTVDRDRTVLTIGNFSLLDVFAGNEFAGDSRTRFMNWSNWTYAAYDHAGDARGFGWGFAVELYRGDWVFRVGRMSAPKEPGGETVDLAFANHYGDQIEVGHDHTLFGHDGHISMLLWHDRAVLARFTDAIAYRYTHVRIDPSVLPFVRTGEHDKNGVGIGLEQSLTDDVGVFLRTMKADGKTETLAFAEADGSVSLGLVADMGMLKRPQDSAGIAWAQNTISKERQGFLAVGGLSLFLGDGALNYGAEKILEAYYNADMGHDIHLTVDYQRILNPGYNRDRGPINIFGFRIHTEF